MRRLKKQFVICEGQFNGGEIEPGTFHVQDSSNSTPPQKSDTRCISNSEEPTSEEESKNGNASAKDGPTGQ